MGDVRPVITIDPAVRFGRPQINGTSVEAIAELVMAGEPVEDVVDELGSTRAVVLTACWWIGLDGPLDYRRLWRNWSNAIHGDLASGQYTAIPDPPSKEDYSA